MGMMKEFGSVVAEVVHRDACRVLDEDVAAIARWVGRHVTRKADESVDDWVRRGFVEWLKERR